MRTPRRHALTIALLALAIAAPTQAAFPGKNGKLAFQSGDDVAVSDADPETDDETFIVPGVLDPRWSPDGTRIVFTTQPSGLTQTQVAVANADGSGFRKLTTAAALEAGRGSWSPDGTRIAFDRYDATDSLERIMVIKADGTGLKPLTSPAVGEYHYSPAWSPDGRTIAYVVSTGEDEDIHLMDADGTNDRVFVSTSADEGDPAWSPDGTRIAFESDQTIVVKPAVGGPLTPITSNGSFPEWSPNGSLVLYDAARVLLAGPVTIGVFASRADGSGDERLLADLASHASWQPLCNVKGTAKANTLNGTAKSELICGKGGNDTIDGKGGLDIIFAGSGNDRVKGGDGNDVLVGERGNDTLNGGTGKDRCIQGPGSGSLISC